MSGLEGLGSSAMNIAVIIAVVFIFICIIVGAFFLLKNLRRYSQFKVIIWEVLEGGGIRESYDQAGIFTMGKTGNKLFYLKRSKVGLKPDNVTYLVNAKGKKVVYLLRYGFKNFIFLNPSSNKGLVTFKVGEEDVNWAINSYEANKKRFSQSLLFQLLPFAILIVVVVVILIMMIYLFKQFSVFRDVAIAIQDASRSLSAFSNMTVVGGGVI